MYRFTWIGVGVTLVALVGYAVGTATPYPGRSFSVTGIMVGIALLVIGHGLGGESP